jgi:glycosyltransferase involved in cell wall biosynthesis
LVLNEAIACGLPVIATRETGAVYSLISEGGNGYLYHCNSKDKLIIHINNIYKEDLIKLGEVSLNIAKNYSTEKMVEDHISAFQIFLKVKDVNI